MIGKDTILSQLKFILVQYRADLNRELYFTKKKSILSSLSEFEKHLNQLFYATTSNLVKLEYTEEEYFEIIETNMNQINITEHFKNCDDTDKELIAKVYASTKNKIEEGLKKAKE